MAQKIIVFVLALTVFLNNTDARAAENYSKTDLSRFQQIIEFGVEGIVTPKVVTFKTLQTLGSFVALKNNATHQFVPHQQKIVEQSSHWTLPIENTSALTEGAIRFLQDQNPETTITFNNQTDELKTLNFTNPKLLILSKLNLTLAPNTVPPKRVTLKAILPGETQWSFILNQVPFQSTLTFPAIQARKLEIQFETENLLRLAEIEWTTTNRAVAQSQQISFYAAEGDAFTLYIQPSFGQSRITTTIDSPTRNNQNTPVFNLPPAVKNLVYNNDFDNDGIPDTQDLCPRVPDPTNADKDKNGLGDACEDPDQDGIASHFDNCPFVKNSDQKDSDLDGIGDLCDDTENRFTEQSGWWINLSFGIMVLALLFLIGRSAWPKKKPQKKTKTPKKKP